MVDGDQPPFLPLDHLHHIGGLERPDPGGHPHPCAWPPRLGAEELDGPGVGHPLGVGAEIGQRGPHPLRWGVEVDDENDWFQGMNRDSPGIVRQLSPL